MGKGIPDLLVSKNRRSKLVEIKDTGGTLTRDQRVFIESWQDDVFIVTTEADVDHVMESLQ